MRPERIEEDATRFILMQVSHPGNVGAAARAIKVMGFSRLVLVAPRDAQVHRHADAIAMASGADDVLAATLVAGSLAEALGDATHVCATAMTPRDFGPPTHAPRAYLPGCAQAGERLALVFGSERFGLANDDVYRCHAALSIPTAPSYGSLNLAQAVQLLAYEWRQALGGFAVTPRIAVPARASAADLEGLRLHWQRTLQAIGFLDPEKPRKLMPRLHQMAHRWRLSTDEVQILHGIARAAEQPHDRQPGNSGQSKPSASSGTK